MKRIKKTFVLICVLFTTFVILVTVATTLVAQHVTTNTTETTKTCKLISNDSCISKTTFHTDK